MADIRLVEQQVALMQPAKIHTTDSIVDCEVLMLSRSKARVRLLGAVPETGDLFLAVRGFGQLACRLERIDSDCADLALCGDAESQDAVFQDILDRFGDEEGRRRFLRRSVLWPGTLSAGGNKLNCTILNMSLGGAKVAVSEECGLSGAVTLQGDRFEGLQATIVWKSGRLLGLQFKEEPAQVGLVLGELLPAIKASA
ncbi:PilZ domain-containing protein [Pelagibius litoralis]|uniref:PilZ domain-containing protein n=1 Tax=Pelagibius litoralis TaxID=374515 RepID=A0A967CAM7_9PROT|nr:PilZ domain-containing protein [Pelagibius litoralis]NIA67529.1 PilZ domain-containing protein [Pelagibius litoralis]